MLMMKYNPSSKNPRSLLLFTQLILSLCHRLLVLAAEVEYPGKTATNIAFGSCHKIKSVNSTDGIIWDAIRELNPDTFIWTGKYSKFHETIEYFFIFCLFNC